MTMRGPRYMVAPVDESGRIRHTAALLITNIRARAFEAAKAAGAVIVDRQTGRVAVLREIAPGDWMWLWGPDPPEAA